MSDILIKGYQIQYSQTRGIWRNIGTFNDNPLLAPSLDAIPDLVRLHGRGRYRICKTLSDGRWTSVFYAELQDEYSYFPADIEMEGAR